MDYQQDINIDEYEYEFKKGNEPNTKLMNIDELEIDKIYILYFPLMDDFYDFCNGLYVFKGEQIVTTQSKFNLFIPLNNNYLIEVHIHNHDGDICTNYVLDSKQYCNKQILIYGNNSPEYKIYEYEPTSYILK